MSACLAVPVCIRWVSLSWILALTNGTFVRKITIFSQRIGIQNLWEIDWLFSQLVCSDTDWVHSIQASRIIKRSSFTSPETLWSPPTSNLLKGTFKGHAHSEQKPSSLLSQPPTDIINSSLLLFTRPFQLLQPSNSLESCQLSSAQISLPLLSSISSSLSLLPSVHSSSTKSHPFASYCLF